jgi:periplasmic divalent cation tolerance protein
VKQFHQDRLIGMLNGPNMNRSTVAQGRIRLNRRHHASLDAARAIGVAGPRPGTDILIFEMTDKIVVLTTCESPEQADQLARKLVEARLAACVNIVSGARSVYRWKGKVEEAAEFVLMIKSRRDLFPALCAALSKLHSYEVPEIIALPIVDGSEAYLSWLERETGPI